MLGKVRKIRSGEGRWEHLSEKYWIAKPTCL
jgi:hypothetical protein